MVILLERINLYFMKIYINMKKFIEVLYWYSTLVKTFQREQNYYMHPIQVMKDLWYECEILVLNADCKIEEDPNFVKWTKVIYAKNIFQFYSYLFKNRNHILYSNTLTIPTLSVWLIWRKTVFIPHNYIYWSNKIKEFIIKFFYRYFSKIRLNNKAEVISLNKIKNNLWIEIPLVISSDFYNPDFKFSSKNIFVSLWNLTRKKHPEIILQALKMVKERWYDFMLKVAWKDYVKDFLGCSYMDLVRKYWLKDNVQYLWYLDYSQFKNTFSWACCYLNASTYEGLCISVYEAVLMWIMSILPNILSFDWILEGGW